MENECRSHSRVSQRETTEVTGLGGNVTKLLSNSVILYHGSLNTNKQQNLRKFNVQLKYSQTKTKLI